jgi:hypothetical protein
MERIVGLKWGKDLFAPITPSSEFIQLYTQGEMKRVEILYVLIVEHQLHRGSSIRGSLNLEITWHIKLSQSRPSKVRTLHLESPSTLPPDYPTQPSKMKPLQRLVSNASLTSCHSCHRSFSTTLRRHKPDFLSDLEKHMTRPAPNTTSPSTTTSEMRTALLRAQQQQQSSSRPVAYRETTTTTFSQPQEGNIYASALSSMDKAEATQSMEYQMARKWRPGDVYSLHDLGPREARKWQQLQKRRQRDVFEMIGQDPVRHYKVRHSIHHPPLLLV